ncbi:hypothetical protein OPQ81_004494 [Rhizoctonia solani]|nr:hypothetical protein OPQ81_004494 [Rhizoctonia solani]
MDSAFTNPNVEQSTRRGTPTQRGYFSENQDECSKYERNSGEVNEVMSPNPPMSHGQMSPKRPKPGPISRSELLSKTNTFKLRVENVPGTQASIPSTRLRQEVFNKPHTLSPAPQSLGTITTGRFSLTPGLSTSRLPKSDDAVLKASDKQVAHSRISSSGKSPSPSPLLKSEPSIFANAIGSLGRIDSGQRRGSGVRSKLSLLSHSYTHSLDEESRVYGFQSGNLLSQSVTHSPVVGDPREEPGYHTPARGSVIPKTPSSEKSTREDSSSVHALRRKCELYEVDQKFDRGLIASQSQIIDELSRKNTQMEEKTRNLESKYTAEVKEVRQRANASLTILTDLQEKFSQTSAGQIKGLKQGLDNFRQEIRDSMTAIEPLLVGYEKMKNTLREIAEEHEQQILEHNDEKTRFQQTNDLLRDQLSYRTGSYTESLEREKELQVSLVSLGESHANVAKALSALHEQYDEMNANYVNSRLAETTATKRVEELEGALTTLKIDNARMKSLLADNEQAFSRKLQALEEDNNSMRTSLEGVHQELSASKSGGQATRSQVQVLLQEKEDLLQRCACYPGYVAEGNERKPSNATLKRDLDLKAQSLDKTWARNQALERQLNDEKRNLEEARAEGDQTMGRLVEKDRATSVRIQELNASLESHRGREGSLMGEIATLNALVSTLRERAEEADEAGAEVRALKKALSEKCADIERIEVENGQLQSQVVQLELARDAVNEEVKQLRETSCITREWENAAQRELYELRQSQEEHRGACEKARISIARMEADMEQVKVALEKEKDAHRLTDKQRETLMVNLSNLQAEHTGILDKSSAIERKLRSSVDESQERIKKLEYECTERENELRQVRHELETANSAKVSAKYMRQRSTNVLLEATLETLASDFRTSVQQARAQREKIESQESKLTTLSNQVSSQKTELRLLEQQLADASTRLLESRADKNAHKAAAESARASAAILEGQLKHKEQDIETIRTELQSYQSLQINAATDTGSTFPLHDKISKQEDVISSLESRILELEKNSETIVDRYKGGKLTNPEKDLVGVVTAGIVQEKNRIINNLKGELKRKDNQVETNKITIANLKDSLAKQIKQTATQLDSNEVKDPSGWQTFNHKHMTISSSPLSEAGWHAPDHDPPAPDSPAAQLAERPLQNPRGHQQPSPQNPIPSPQSHHILAPIGLESGNATDGIQEFEESRVPDNISATSRKRTIVSIEPLDDEVQEEHERETKRKSRVKAKKDKIVGESNGPKGQSNKADGPSISAKGKATKRRKA